MKQQWPGYNPWRRQIATRDETHARNPITLARFMKHVGTSVNNFFKVRPFRLRYRRPRMTLPARSTCRAAM